MRVTRKKSGGIAVKRGGFTELFYTQNSFHWHSKYRYINASCRKSSSLTNQCCCCCCDGADRNTARNSKWCGGRQTLSFAIYSNKQTKTNTITVIAKFISIGIIRCQNQEIGRGQGAGLFRRPGVSFYSVDLKQKLVVT